MSAEDNVAKLIAELERVNAYLLQMEPQVAALEKDAARYRWLRDKDTQNEWPGLCYRIRPYTTDAVDAEIDRLILEDV